MEGEAPPPFHHHRLPSDKALASQGLPQMPALQKPQGSLQSRVLICQPGKTLTGIADTKWEGTHGTKGVLWSQP